MARLKGKLLLSSNFRTWWESEGKAKWEDETRLLLMKGKTGRIQVSGSVRVYVAIVLKMGRGRE